MALKVTKILRILRKTVRESRPCLSIFHFYFYFKTFLISTFRVCSDYEFLKFEFFFLFYKLHSMLNVNFARVRAQFIAQLKLLPFYFTKCSTRYKPDQ